MIISINKVESRMAEIGISQRDLAVRMGISPPSINYTLASIRNGREIRPSTAHNLARGLGVEVDSILGRKRVAA